MKREFTYSLFIVSLGILALELIELHETQVAFSKYTGQVTQSLNSTNLNQMGICADILQDLLE